jgi:hypothetical protein
MNLKLFFTLSLIVGISFTSISFAQCTSAPARAFASRYNLSVGSESTTYTCGSICVTTFEGLDKAYISGYYDLNNWFVNIKHWGSEIKLVHTEDHGHNFTQWITTKFFLDPQTLAYRTYLYNDVDLFASLGISAAAEDKRSGVCTVINEH